MSEKFTAQAETTINAPTSKVWQALTDPKMVKEWLFGTEITTDWKVGSLISYKGKWEGKDYEDKGKVLRFEPERLIETEYWSSFSGPETPENIQIVKYKLDRDGEATKVAIIQSNISTQEAAQHSQGNWQTVLNKMKEILEK